MNLPLANFGFRFVDFKGLAGASDEWMQFSQTTVIVGRNNVGKSALIDAIRFAVDTDQTFNPEWHRHGKNARYHLKQVLEEKELQSVFRPDTSGGVIGANHWEFGKAYVGLEVSREFDSQRRPRWLEAPRFPLSAAATQTYLMSLNKVTPFPKAKVFGIAAERNVVPERQNPPAPVKPDGEGLTNLIRSFLYDTALSMDEIEVGLLNDLNFIFRNDQEFERIICRLDDGNIWEIFLIQKGGGAVRLSQSGSSLKSIFIMLAAIRLNPKLDSNTDIRSSVFYIEEPENNLHPGLLRRLLDYLSEITQESEANLVISTHSPTAIDWASRRKDTGLFHVRRGDDGAIVSAVKEYGSTRRLLDDLDVRASEILQANGVIWVEGPTERIYLRTWIEIFSNGELVEGQHYAIMFYGGKLLSHLSCAEPGSHNAFIDLLRMNRNLCLLMDSDRRITKSGSFRSHINDTKKRIVAEAKAANGLTWLSDGREIENYLSARVCKTLNSKVTNIGKYDSVPDALGMANKVRLAESASAITRAEDLDTLDLKPRLAELCATIERWNSGA